MASTGKKWLIGCGIGCMSLVLIIAAVMFGFYIWLNQSSELLEPEGLLGSDTSGHVEWTLRLEDPGTNEFVETLLAISHDESARDMEGVPPMLRSWLLKYQGRKNERELRELFPLVAAWTVYPGPSPEEDMQLFSASIERLGNRLVLADWIMGMTLGRAEDASVIEHKGEKIYELPTHHGKSITFFIHRNNLFFATELEAAKRAVDRLNDPAQSGRGSGGVERMLQEVAADRPLRGALTNERGELGRLLGWLWREEDLGELSENISALRITGGFEGGDRFGGLLELRCTDPAWAGANADLLAGALEESCEGIGLEIETSARSEGEWVAVEFRTEQLPEFIKGLLRGRNISFD
jgi:hypothetical protein